MRIWRWYITRQEDYEQLLALAKQAEKYFRVSQNQTQHIANLRTALSECLDRDRKHPEEVIERA